MSDLELRFDYDIGEKTLTVGVNGRSCTIKAGEEVEQLVRSLGDWLIEEKASGVFNLEVKPYDEHMRRAHIVALRIPRIDEVSRERLSPIE